MPTVQIKRGWMPYAKAAQEYLGVSPSVLLGAIRNHELRAYEKPISRGRKTADPDNQRHRYYVCTDDVDEYIRTYWTPAFDE